MLQSRHISSRQTSRSSPGYLVKALRLSDTRLLYTPCLSPLLNCRWELIPFLDRHVLETFQQQKRHELEGAPDPFPSLGFDAPAKHRAKASNFLDTESEVAFPSLSSSTPATLSRTSSSNSAWGAASGPRIKSTGQKVPVFVDSFTLSAIDLSHTGKAGRPTTLGDVMRQVMAKYKVKIEASANQRARQTTFHLKAESQKELDKAKRSLLALLSPVVRLFQVSSRLHINYHTSRSLSSSMLQRQRSRPL